MELQNNMKVMVISAHPDDMEISCSGTLKRFKNLGADILNIITVKPSVETNNNRNKNIVTKELKNSYNISGFRLKILDTDLHDNGRPNLICDNNTIDKLNELIEQCDIAIIHNPEDSHQDHQTSYKLSWPLVNKIAKEVWLMTSWPYCLTYKTNSANLFYDISDTWNFKQSLLESYPSYITSEKIKLIKNANQYFGQSINQSLAESFTIVKKYV